MYLIRIFTPRPSLFSKWGVLPSSDEISFHAIIPFQLPGITSSWFPRRGELIPVGWGMVQGISVCEVERGECREEGNRKSDCR